MTTVAGIDLAAGRGATAIASLMLPGHDTVPALHELVREDIATDDDILASIARISPRVLAFDAPLSLPMPVAQAIRGEPQTKSFPSPYTRAAERDPAWTKLGVRPLPVSFLGGLAFRAISLLPRLRSIVPDAAIIEAFPTGALRSLGVRVAADRKRTKSSVSVRAAVQQSLTLLVQALPSPDEELLSADQLDAIAAALTGVAFLQGRSTAVGDPAEGQIYLPIWQEPAWSR